MEETKKCYSCGEDRPLDKFSDNGAGYKKNVCQRCYGRRERAKLRLDILTAYDCKCACCGQNHPLFLTLDHINNDGRVHRDTMNEQQIARQVRREGYPKDKYQLLCWDCNCAKGHFGECPHKTGITANMAMQQLQQNSLGFGRGAIKHANQYMTHDQIEAVKSGELDKKTQSERDAKYAAKQALSALGFDLDKVLSKLSS